MMMMMNWLSGFIEPSSELGVATTTTTEQLVAGVSVLQAVNCRC